MWLVHFVLQHGALSGFLINSMRLPGVDSDHVNLSVYDAAAAAAAAADAE